MTINFEDTCGRLEVSLVSVLPYVNEFLSFCACSTVAGTSRGSRYALQDEKGQLRVREIDTRSGFFGRRRPVLSMKYLKSLICYQNALEILDLENAELESLKVDDWRLGSTAPVSNLKKLEELEVTMFSGFLDCFLGCGDLRRLFVRVFLSEGCRPAPLLRSLSQGLWLSNVEEIRLCLAREFEFEPIFVSDLEEQLAFMSETIQLLEIRGSIWKRICFEFRPPRTDDQIEFHITRGANVLDLVSSIPSDLPSLHKVLVFAKRHALQIGYVMWRHACVFPEREVMNFLHNGMKVKELRVLRSGEPNSAESLLWLIQSNTSEFVTSSLKGETSSSLRSWFCKAEDLLKSAPTRGIKLLPLGIKVSGKVEGGDERVLEILRKYLSEEGGLSWDGLKRELRSVQDSWTEMKDEELGCNNGNRSKLVIDLYAL